MEEEPEGLQEPEYWDIFSDIVSIIFYILREAVPMNSRQYGFLRSSA